MIDLQRTLLACGLAGLAFLPRGAGAQVVGPTMFELGDFTLESGEVIEDAFLRYATLGEPREGGANAILLPSAFLGTLGGYNRLVGPGRVLDPEVHYLVLVELFGSGGSSSPSNASAGQRGSAFPLVSIRDNVAAQHRLLTEELGLSRLQAVVGFSMGAQQAFQWAVSHPDFMEVIVPIAGTAKTYPHGVVRLESALTLIAHDPEILAGRDTLSSAGKRAWSLHWQAWIYSTEWWRQERFRSESVPDVETLLLQAEGLAPTARPYDYLVQARAWQTHDVGASPGFGGVEEALRSIRARVVYVPVETDMYFPPTDARYEARFLRNVDLRPLPSVWGHMAGNGITEEDRAFLGNAIAAGLGEVPPQP